jgi:hypothetical protein
VINSVEEFGQVHVDTMSVSRADMMLDLEDGLLDQSVDDIWNAEISERTINKKGQA